MIFEKISPKIIFFFETLEKEKERERGRERERERRGGERSQGFLRRFMGFCQSEVVGLKTKVHHLDKGYA